MIRETINILDEIHTERERQVNIEGFTSEHDDEHFSGTLVRAAACYLLQESAGLQKFTNGIPRIWPWEQKWWKPKDKRRNLIRALALIVAEIERMDRNGGK